MSTSFCRLCRIDSTIFERKKVQSITPVQVLQAFFFTSADLIMSMNSGWKIDAIGEKTIIITGHGEKKESKITNFVPACLYTDYWGHRITFKEAPPTKKPSTSGFAASSLQLAPLTDPENEMQFMSHVKWSIEESMLQKKDNIDSNLCDSITVIYRCLLRITKWYIFLHQCQNKIKNGWNRNS